MEAPDRANDVTIGFDKGDAVSIDGRRCRRRALFARLNELGRDNGVGRVDMVENRFVGMKSRGIYETPGGTILLAAHRAMELITLDRGAGHLKDELMPRYAELIYNGSRSRPSARCCRRRSTRARSMSRARCASSSTRATSSSRAAKSAKSLYSTSLVTFEDDKGAYDQKDAEGFIRLNALRLQDAGGAESRKAEGAHVLRHGDRSRSRASRSISI